MYQSLEQKQIPILPPNLRTKNIFKPKKIVRV